MSLKKIREYNDDKFIEDIKRVHTILVWASDTEWYFKTTKREVLREAETSKIHYQLSNKIYRNRREVMVIL